MYVLKIFLLNKIAIFDLNENIEYVFKPIDILR